MSRSSGSDEKRLVEAVLKVLGRRVTAIRPKEDAIRRPFSAAAEEVLGSRPGDVQKALDALGLRTVRQDVEESSELRRLVSMLLAGLADERRAAERPSDESSAEEPGPKLFDLVQETDGEVLAPWFDDPPDVRPSPVQAKPGTASRAPSEAEVWRVQMRQALIGDLEKEEGARLIRSLRHLSRQAHARRDILEALRKPHPTKEEPESASNATKSRDGHLAAAARPIVGMLDRLVQEAPYVLKPLLREVRDSFHLSGYKVDDLRQSTQANDWRMRQLQEHLGLPAIDLLQELRMELAMRLLRDTSRSVRKVAKAMGYQSARAFRKLSGDWCGLPPSRLRRRLKAIADTLQSLPEEAFSWFFLDRCRRGRGPAGDPASGARAPRDPVRSDS